MYLTVDREQGDTSREIQIVWIKTPKKTLSKRACTRCRNPSVTACFDGPNFAFFVQDASLPKRQQSLCFIAAGSGALDLSRERGIVSAARASWSNGAEQPAAGAAGTAL